MKPLNNSSNPENGPWVIFGLGNPEPKYMETRHNFGFLVTSELRQHLGVKFNKELKNSVYAQTNLDNIPLVIVRPGTYVNRSGWAAREVITYFNIPSHKLLVIYDDINLPLGMIRVKKKGGHGGHNGIRSIIESLGTQEFPRIKAGIDNEKLTPIDLADFVLTPFNDDEIPLVETMIEKTIEAIFSCLKQGLEKTMQAVNQRIKTNET